MQTIFTMGEKKLLKSLKTKYVQFIMIKRMSTERNSKEKKKKKKKKK